MSFITSTVKSSNGWEQNGNYVFDKPEKKNSAIIGIREKFEINEWTFSLFLFCFSLSIVIGKLFLNYGDAFKQEIEGNYKASSLSTFPNIIANLSSLSSSFKPKVKFNSDQLMAVGENFLNVSQRYEEAVSDAVIKFSIQNGKWMKAALSGFAMMAFTWCIIYKDSSVPGVNPPSPLSLTRKRGQSRFSMDINYFVGVLNGILIFIYLTL